MRAPRPSTRRFRSFGARRRLPALAGGQTLLNVMKARAAAPGCARRPARISTDLRDDRLLLRRPAPRSARWPTYTQLVGSSEVEVARPILAEVAATIADRPGAKSRHRRGETSASATRRTICRRSCSRSQRRSRSSCQDGERVVPADAAFFLGVYMTAVSEGELLTKLSSARQRRRRRVLGSHDRQARHVCCRSRRSPPPGRPGRCSGKCHPASRRAARPPASMPERRAPCSRAPPGAAGCWS